MADDTLTLRPKSLEVEDVKGTVRLRGFTRDDALAFTVTMTVEEALDFAEHVTRTARYALRTAARA